MIISSSKRKSTINFIFQLVLIFVGHTAFSQQTNDSAKRIKDDEALLDQVPYFADHQVLATDSLFIHDIAVLKYFISFDSVEAELLKVPILKEILSVEVRKNKPDSYRTIVDYMKDFRRTIAYKDFVSGVLLFRELENKRVNPKNWDTDQALFVKLGFTESDLADFRVYIRQRKHRKLSYKAAYLQYMKEIDDLGTVSTVD